ncbi:hypothetical protein D3C81_184500 [compost metagenome]
MSKTVENNRQSSLEFRGRGADCGHCVEQMGLTVTGCVSSSNRQASCTSAEAKPCQLVSP